MQPKQSSGLTRLSVFGLALLTLATVAILFTGLGDYGVVGGDEAVYHHITREMRESGDWWRLQSGGLFSPRAEFRNAPFHYWIRSLLIDTVGDNGWSMRGLSALAGCLVVLGTFGFGRALGGKAVGFLAAIIQLTSFNFLWLHGAKTGELDAMATAAVLACAWTFTTAQRQGTSFIKHHFALAVLCNIKAPLALPVVLADLLVLATYRDREASIRWLRSGLLIAPIAMAWHLARFVALGTRLSEYLVSDVTFYAWRRAERISGVSPLDNLAYYIRVLGAAAWPWGIIGGSAATWTAAKLLRSRLLDRDRLVPLAYALVLFGFFTAIAKHNVWYMTPLGPMLAVLSALWLTGLKDPQRTWSGRLSLGFLFLLPFVLRPTWPPQSPLRQGAQLYPLHLEWGPSLSWETLVPLCALSLSLLWSWRWWLRENRGPLFSVIEARVSAGRALSLAAVAALILQAGLRTLLPLADTNYRQPVEAFARDIAAKLNRGETVETPLELPTSQMKLALYFFGADFQLCRSREPRKPKLYLYEYGRGADCIADSRLPALTANYLPPPAKKPLATKP